MLTLCDPATVVGHLIQLILQCISCDQLGSNHRLDPVARLPGVQGSRYLLLAALYPLRLQSQNLDQGTPLRAGRSRICLLEYGGKSMD